MEFVIDVGNSETALGIVDAGTLDVRAHWRLSTPIPRTPDEYGLLLRSLLRDAGISHDQLTMAVLGSVVPSATGILMGALEQIVGEAPIVVDARSPLPIRLDVDEPLTVGADRIVNTLAAKEMYGRDTIAVDLGTATTFDCITADGVFVGGNRPGSAVRARMAWQEDRQAPSGRVAQASGGARRSRMAWQEDRQAPSGRVDPPHKRDRAAHGGVHPERRVLLGGRCRGRDGSADSGRVAAGRRVRGRDRRIRHHRRPLRPDRGPHRTLPHALRAGPRREDDSRIEQPLRNPLRIPVDTFA